MLSEKKFSKSCFRKCLKKYTIRIFKTTLGPVFQNTQSYACKHFQTCNNKFNPLMCWFQIVQLWLYCRQTRFSSHAMSTGIFLKAEVCSLCCSYARDSAVFIWPELCVTEGVYNVTGRTLTDISSLAERPANKSDSDGRSLLSNKSLVTSSSLSSMSCQWVLFQILLSCACLQWRNWNKLLKTCML